MKIVDTNKWLNPPEGFGDPIDVRADGAYLRAEYNRTEYWDADCIHKRARTIVVIYLNDSGREVLRTTDDAEWEKPKPEPPAPPLTWYEQFAEWIDHLLGEGE